MIIGLLRSTTIISIGSRRSSSYPLRLVLLRCLRLSSRSMRSISTHSRCHPWTHSMPILPSILGPCTNLCRWLISPFVCISVIDKSRCIFLSFLYSFLSLLFKEGSLSLYWWFVDLVVGGWSGLHLGKLLFLLVLHLFPINFLLIRLSIQIMIWFHSKNILPVQYSMAELLDPYCF